MGTIYKATCTCGFELFKLLQGHGMTGQQHNFEILQCDQCHTLVNVELDQSVDSLFEPMPCHHCKGHMVRLGSLPDQHEHYCPECHEMILEMSVIRLWG